MKVFICAAGKGTRLKHISKDYPKPLLKIGKYSILEYLLLMFSSHNKVKEIHIIVGYKKELFKKIIGNDFNRIPVFYHHNHKYNETNNLYSLYCSRKYMVGDILFSTADLIIDPVLLRKFIDEKEGNKVLVDSSIKLKDDIVKVECKNDIIINMSKKLHANRAYSGAVGLYRMSGDGIKDYFKTCNYIFKKYGKDVGFIEPIPYLKETQPFYASDYVNFTWFDVDNEVDYELSKYISSKLYLQLNEL